MVEKGTIHASFAQSVFHKLYDSGRIAVDIVNTEGLVQVGDEAALTASVTAVMEANPAAAAQYRNGKTGTFGFLVGQVMKATGGKANPRLVNELVRRELEN